MFVLCTYMVIICEVNVAVDSVLAHIQEMLGYMAMLHEGSLIYICSVVDILV